jgi:hypothetical protein
MTKYYKKINKCKVCGSENLEDVFSLDPQYISATFVQDNEKEGDLAKIKIPMTLTLCSDSKTKTGCGLLQLREEVESDFLYTRYFYRSSTNQTMINDLKKVVIDIQDKVNLADGDVVVDIGANDCTMIQFYPKNLNRIAIEPAKNIDWSSVDPSIKIINNYFSANSFEDVMPSKKVKAFSCCAMFYDLADPNKFVSDIKALLAEDGIWCIQLSYLPSMINNMNFYDICHEHLSYYSIRSLSYLLEKNGLNIFDVSLNDVNGGSARVFISHKENKKYSKSINLQNLIHIEDEMKLTSKETYANFYARMLELQDKVKAFFKSELEKGNKIIGLGASTKGNILLQFLGITKDMMPFISEINHTKIGLRTLGSDFELISEEAASSLKPAIYFVLPWYFKDEIIKREDKFTKSGGSLLFPMPYVHLVNQSGETRL